LTIAVVTGASRGIGRASALALADTGFDVALVARSAAGLDETRDLIGKRGGSAFSIVADVTDGDEVRTAFQKIEERGQVAVLVNNAGSLLAIGPLWEVDPDDWWSDLRTSIGGVFNFCRVVVPRMIARRDGRIINVTSYAALRPAPYETGYACAKAGIVSLTEALAASLEDHGVKAFAVAPGFTRTEMTRGLTESEAGRRWLPGVGERPVVDVERSADLISMLASGAADVLNGRLLHALDNVDALLGRVHEIRRDDLYVPRLRRLAD